MAASSSGHAGHGHHAADARAVDCVVLTVSDTRTEADDASGALLRRLLEEAGHRVLAHAIVRDEPAEVRALLLRHASEGKAGAVLLTGGTGISPRDSTYEAVDSLLDKRLDGFGELFRMLSWEEIGAAAMMSRATAGLMQGMAVFSMPGSSAACRLAMEKLILPQLGHVAGLARPGRQGGHGNGMRGSS